MKRALDELFHAESGVLKEHGPVYLGHDNTWWVRVKESRQHVRGVEEDDKVEVEIDKNVKN